MNHTISKTTRVVRFTVATAVCTLLAGLWLKHVFGALLWMFFKGNVVPFDAWGFALLGLAIWGKWCFQLAEGVMNWGLCVDEDEAAYQARVEQGRAEAQRLMDEFYEALRQNNEKFTRDTLESIQQVSEAQFEALVNQPEPEVVLELRRQVQSFHDPNRIEVDAFNQHDELNRPAKRED